MKEVADIVKNAENDEAALAFLQDTLEDDFPDLELGTMDLHEAIKSLGGEEADKDALGDRETMENLTAKLESFMMVQRGKEKREVKKTKRTKRKRRSKK